MPPQLPYVPIAGVVPCPGGWLVQPARLINVTIVPEEPFVLDTLVDVVDYRPTFTTIVLGAPIGFPDEPVGGFRSCDREAGEMLGWPNRLAIAPVPSRAALAAPTYAEAAALEPWLTPLEYRRFRFLREIDAEIQPYHQRRVFSAVPELSFYLVNGDEPPRSSAFWREGPTERARLLEDRLPGFRPIFELPPPKGASIRHVVEAGGLLWTARRISGKAITRVPMDPEWDEIGRRMEIVR